MHSSVRSAIRRRPLALGLALALAAPAALADDATTAALERRIAELERMVSALIEQQASPAPSTPSTVPAATEPAPAAVAAVSGGNRGTTFSYGGFIKSDFIYSRYSDGDLAAGNIGRDFYIPSLVPVGGSSSSAFDAHAKQSRFFFATDTTTEDGNRIGSRIELDFAVPVGGDERQTNTYNPVVRQAFFTYNQWLFGQAWSNFQEVRALPEGADFVGPTEGTIFVRQAQVRYSSGPFAIALENPSATITPFGGGGRIVTDSATLPDVTARWSNSGPWGFFTVAGLLRQVRINQGGFSDTEVGAGISVSGRWNIGDDDIRYMVTAGTGIGRYLALNFGEDAVLDANGQLDAIDAVAGFVAYRRVWAERLRSNFVVSAMEIDQDSALTGVTANRRAHSFSANLIYSPTARVDVGLEYRWAERELESGVTGSLNRLQALARYSF